MNIHLYSLLQSQEGWGQQRGRQVRARLEALIALSPTEPIIRISLAGIMRTDVPFARSAVVELAAHARPRRGFCLVEVHDVDILDNWDAAALHSQQPLMVWYPNGSYRLLGPQPSIGMQASFEYVLARPDGASTHEVAKALHLQLPNTGNKLKSLWEAGYVLRQEATAPHGKREYDYFRIA
jgi:hypothetical protein